MKTKRFKIIALICAALFTITLAIGIVFACLPEERKVESAVPLADTTTEDFCWSENHRADVVYSDIIHCTYSSKVPSDFSGSGGDFYRAREGYSYSFPVSGYIKIYGVPVLCNLATINVLSISQMESAGKDPNLHLPLEFISVDSRDGTVRSIMLPGYDTTIVLIPTAGKVPECIYLFFEYLCTCSTGYSSSYFTSKSKGFTEGYGEGWTDGYTDCEADNRVIWTDEGYYQGHKAGINEGYNQGRADGYDAGHTAGYNEGYSAGQSHGSGQGYDTGYEEGHAAGYDEGYADGENHSISSQFTNPIGYFLQPVHDFMNTPFFGDLTYAAIFNVILFVSVAIIFIKMFSGG